MVNNTYAIIETLNGNYILKHESKIKVTDYIEQEIYAKTIEDAKVQFKQHMQELKQAGLI